MTARKTPTRAQLNILKSPIEALRRVTTIERLLNPALFSTKGAYYVPKTVEKITSRTAFVTVTLKRDFQTGVSHTKAAAERAAGVREYKTAASEAQAAKTRVWAEVRRALAATPVGTEVPVEKKIRKGPRKGEKRIVHEYVSQKSKDQFLEWRRRKLEGRHLDEGDWHEMMTVARATNDPMLNVLLRS